MSFGLAAAGHNPNKSAEIVSPPNDGISSLCWSPKANHLVATSWDNEVRCWEVDQNGNSQPKAAMKHDAPVLCSAWKDDGSTVFTGGCDNKGKMWNLAAGGQEQQVAQHDAPIKACKWIPEMNMLVTGSWDKTLRYWDLRQPTPAATVPLSERLYSMDVRHPLMVCGTADKGITIFNLQTPQTPHKQIPSPLKHQTRAVACFPDKSGFLVGSIEGRVAVHHVEDSQQSKNFTFKCHRKDGTAGQPTEIYPVNCMDFHPQHGTFATTGSDGTVNFWDKDSKQRLKAMQACNAPIPCGAFNGDGRFFAYAVSYDWTKGAEHHNPAVAKNHILIHQTQEKEVKARGATRR
jgi:mRNA export factor